MYARIDTEFPRAPQTGARVSATAATPGSATRTAAAISFVYCVVGTMGFVTPEQMAQREATSNWGVQYKFPTKVASASEDSAAIALQPSPAQDLERIRHVLKPTVLELANLFGVSRQAVYDWQSGAQPNPQTTRKLAELAGAAQVFAQAGFPVTTQVLRRKVSGGLTLLDAVLTGGNAVQLAQSLVKTLQREGTQRERLAQQFAGRKRAPVDVSQYGAPNLAEDA